MQLELNFQNHFSETWNENGQILKVFGPLFPLKLSTIFKKHVSVWEPAFHQNSFESWNRLLSVFEILD